MSTKKIILIALGVFLLIDLITAAVVIAGIAYYGAHKTISEPRLPEYQPNHITENKASS